MNWYKNIQKRVVIRYLVLSVMIFCVHQCRSAEVKDVPDAPLVVVTSRSQRMLIQAIQKNDIEGVKAAIALGADVNGSIERKYAYQRFSYPRMRHGELSNKQVLSTHKPKQIFPLQCALYFASDEIFLYLLEQGAHINQIIDPENNITILHDYLTYHPWINNVSIGDPFYHPRPRLDKVIMLLTHGATVDTLDRFYNKNALMLAVELGSLETVQRMLMKYPDVDLNVRDRWGESLLIKALRNSDFHRSIFIFLLQNYSHKINVNLTTATGETALHYAVLFKQLPAIQLLLDAGADVNIRHQEGETPLDVATKRDHREVEGYEEIIAILTEAAAQTKRWTPLRAAWVGANVRASIQRREAAQAAAASAGGGSAGPGDAPRKRKAQRKE